MFRQLPTPARFVVAALIGLAWAAIYVALIWGSLWLGQKLFGG